MISANELKKKVSAIVPAYNEAENIGRILSLLISLPLITEVIVVDDGSNDQTAEVVKNTFPQVKVISLPYSQGKANALLAGAKAACCPILFFCDADLTSLKANHLRSLLNPVLEGKVRMMVGAQEFMDPSRWGKKRRAKKEMNEFIKGLGGEKVLFKKDFFQIPGIKDSGYGVEHLIINYFQDRQLSFDYLVLKGVSHVHKVQKWGIIKGGIKDLKSYFTFTRQLLGKSVTKLRSYFSSVK